VLYCEFRALLLRNKSLNQRCKLTRINILLAALRSREPRLKIMFCASVPPHRQKKIAYSSQTDRKFIHNTDTAPSLKPTRRRLVPLPPLVFLVAMTARESLINNGKREARGDIFASYMHFKNLSEPRIVFHPIQFFTSWSCKFCLSVFIPFNLSGFTCMCAIHSMESNAVSFTRAVRRSTHV